MSQRISQQLCVSSTAAPESRPIVQMLGLVPHMAVTKCMIFLILKVDGPQLAHFLVGHHCFADLRL